MSTLDFYLRFTTISFNFFLPYSISLQALFAFAIRYIYFENLKTYFAP